MKTNPVSNPYEPPKTPGEPNASVAIKNYWFSGPLPVNVMTCLIANFMVLAMANTALFELYADFKVELPVLSKIAFSVARNWITASVILLGFAAVTIYAKSHLDVTNRRKIFIYTALVSGVWALITAVFAFGILMPLFSMNIALY